MIDENVIAILKNCNITSMQITLDGSKNFHNKKRFTKYGEDTYTKILNNIRLVALNDIKVEIRVNIDVTNINCVDEVLLDIKKLNIKTIPYIGWIKADTDACKNYKSHCVSDELYFQKEFEFYEKLKKFGFINTLKEIMPKKRCVQCTTYCHEDSFLFDSEGNIYDCWKKIGDNEKSLGKLENQIKKDNKTIVNSKCINCSWYPICFGGCPVEEPKCCYWKNFYKNHFVKEVK